MTIFQWHCYEEREQMSEHVRSAAWKQSNFGTLKSCEYRLFLNRKVTTKNAPHLKVDLSSPISVRRDWIVPLKMVAKMCGHWPYGLPPRVLAGYIEDLARNFIFRTESQCHGSPPGSNKVSNSFFYSSWSRVNQLGEISCLHFQVSFPFRSNLIKIILICIFI